MESSSFRVDRRAVESVELLVLSGRLTLGESSREFRRVLDAALADGRNRLVLELTGVPYVDSAGLGAIAMASKMALDAGGKLALTGVQERVKQLLDLTRVSSVISSFPTEVEAVEAVRTDQAN